MQIATELEQTLHELIPISCAMGVKVDHWEQGQLQLSAPLANNINHQQSAFGGSLFSMAAMAGWGLLQLALAAEQLEANIVIADGAVEYQRPVFEPLVCQVDLPARADWQAFVDQLRSQRRADLTLEPRLVLENGKTAMQLRGHFVVSLPAEIGRAHV